MELESIINLVGPARGGRGKTGAYYPPMVVTRELDQSDLPLILNPPALGLQAPTLTRIRHQHHTLARLLSDGHKKVEVAAIVGCSPGSIQLLEGDPAFQELCAYYKQQKDGVYLDVHQRLAALGMTAVEELQARLDDEDEAKAMTTRAVVEIATLALDRSVAPSKVPGQGGGQGTVLNINFVAPKDQGPTIEGQVG